MNQTSSPYYPRRRRWYRGTIEESARLLRRLNVQSISLPQHVAWWQLIYGLALPGYAFGLTGWPRLARGIQIGWMLGVLVFFAALGYGPGNTIFGLLIAAHVASLVHLLTFLSEEPGIRTRLVFGASSWMVLGLCVYFPLRSVILEHWLVPLRTAEGVVIVNRTRDLKTVRRGDFIAYEVAGQGARAVTISSGFGIGDIIGRPGDEVRITPRLVFVNGQPQLRRPHMPREVEFTLSEKQWFVWPEFDIRNNNRNITQTDIAAAWLHTGMIHQDEIIGRPYRRWFGRRQHAG